MRLKIIDMSVFDYPIGSPFHYEMEMKSGDEVDALAKLLNDGKLMVIVVFGLLRAMLFMVVI